MPKIGNYTEAQLTAALAAVRNGMPKKTVAVKFQVPRQTIQFKLSHSFRKTSYGPPPVLNSDEERMLVQWIATCSRKGFPWRKCDLQEAVKEYLEANERQNSFVNNKPGDGWYKAFLKRHPEVAVRMSEEVTRASAVVSESDIRNWFDSVEKLLDDVNLKQILEDSSRIFNGDETGFQLSPKTGKVLSIKGLRSFRK